MKTFYSSHHHWLISLVTYAVVELSSVPNWHVIALDRSKVALHVAEQHLKRSVPQAQQDAVQFKEADLTRTGLAARSVDVVVAYNVLEVVPNLRAALKEVSSCPQLLRSTISMLPSRGELCSASVLISVHKAPWS